MTATGADPDQPLMSVEEFTAAAEAYARGLGVEPALSRAHEFHEAGYDVAVPLSGGSTPDDSPFTVGSASLAKAIAGGFAGRPPGKRGQPAAHASEVLKAWQERRAAQTSSPQSDVLKAIADDPGLREQVAMSLAKRAADDHRARTGDSLAATHAAYARYHETGGRRSFSAFKSELSS